MKNEFPLNRGTLEKEGGAGFIPAMGDGAAQAARVALNEMVDLLPAAAGKRTVDGILVDFLFHLSIAKESAGPFAKSQLQLELPAVPSRIRI